MLTNIAVRLNSLIITFLNLSMQVQALGLATEYRNPDGEVKPFVQLMASVAFCPLTYVRPAWLAIQQQAPNIPRVDELVRAMVICVLCGKGIQGSTTVV